MSSDSIWKLQQRLPGSAAACLPGVSITMLKVSWFMTAFCSVSIKSSWTWTWENGAWDKPSLCSLAPEWILLSQKKLSPENHSGSYMCAPASPFTCLPVWSGPTGLFSMQQDGLHMPSPGIMVIPFPCWEQAVSCSKLLHVCIKQWLLFQAVLCSARLHFTSSLWLHFQSEGPIVL